MFSDDEKSAAVCGGWVDVVAFARVSFTVPVCALISSTQMLPSSVEEGLGHLGVASTLFRRAEVTAVLGVLCWSGRVSNWCGVGDCTS